MSLSFRINRIRLYMIILFKLMQYISENLQNDSEMKFLNGWRHLSD